MKNILSRLISLFFLCIPFCALALPPARDYYEIKVYTVADKRQEEAVDQFLKVSYLPALHRAGIAKIGVFKPVETDTALFGKRIFVLIPVGAFDDLEKLEAKLVKDNEFQNSSAAYWSSPYDNPPFSRVETILLKAFSNASQYQVPKLNGPAGQKIYELRSYEGPTERLFINKVKMFNDGDEIGLFKRLEFNAVFYAEVIAGSRMPNLMYMTSFDNMTVRDEHWKTFVNDPQWKKLSTMSEYQHNVSKINIYLLHPTDYSEL